MYLLLSSFIVAVISGLALFFYGGQTLLSFSLMYLLSFALGALGSRLALIHHEMQANKLAFEKSCMLNLKYHERFLREDKSK